VTSFSRQKCSNSKNKKHTICKNDMFYVCGKFCRNRINIKEIEARWRFGMHFCQACFCVVGVMYSGEYDVCDVTLSVHPHRAS
jgi:hypothetical protein